MDPLAELRSSRDLVSLREQVVALGLGSRLDEPLAALLARPGLSPWAEAALRALDTRQMCANLRQLVSSAEVGRYLRNRASPKARAEICAAVAALIAEAADPAVVEPARGCPAA